MKLRKLLCIGLFSILAVMAGCTKTTPAQGAGQSTNTSKVEESNKETTVQGDVNSEEESKANAGSVMDFNQKFEWKKPAEPVSSSPRILFIGNSFVFANDLPGMFADLSQSGGFTPEITELTNGGYKLKLFADTNDVLGAEVDKNLKEHQWDFVILQEQSRIPTYSAEKNMYPAARTLDGLAKAAGAQTVFFMTWAYKDGDNLRDVGVNKSTSMEEMQTQLVDSYMKIADELGSLTAPVGIAFMRSNSQYPEIELWDSEDLMHPTPAGTYLASCTFYAALYQQSPIGLDYTGDLDGEVAAKLQQIATDLVLN